MKKKEIIYISDSCIPSYSADSIHVMKMCHALSNQGYQVTLVGKRTRNMVNGISDIHSFYGVENCFDIILFPKKAFKFSGRLYNLMLPFFGIKAQRIAYTRSIYAAFWYSLLKKEIAFEIHEPFNTKNGWLKFLFQFIVERNNVKKWIVISLPLKDHLITEFGIDSKAILLAHDGADKIQKSNPEIRLNNEKLKVGYVGSLFQGKGMEIILPLSKKMKQIDFHVVGGNEAQLEFWKTQFSGEENNLIFHGFQSPKNSQKFMNQFDILLAPYLQKVFVKSSKKSNNLSKWMSPLKIFEYMAVGKPIIASDLPVIREILTHNESAILCDPDSLEDWEISLMKLIEFPEFSKQLGNQARVVLESKFTWDIRSKKILDFLESNEV
ncbi:glycosyltransferase family 4 protein [Algoriphagus zhangzhouensis]|uniref:Glycosyltransferase involved in cell wall bisynthesis n=1 Tax=Algoriphagus zhangzhouensis TaxID=1073327 RepID=A0A1M7ZKH6_9BACT|nr:glycosyltransferase family 4 protein [Algoriphagus zhangzhouensis]TDY42868.1 glycosyltransferase involved in cell wall biosynthesis [Algoriphagus zhangzhouensis]SHO65381.1 Glycosyltransferase involved in cell wall bisynthesis [Algoriphagus zhangzhouensis]